ncbi:MAG: DUF4403 family protein [Desulfuromonadaceae bacterium]|nr:DUF4403 family protein [Desulfuromonadaceae bacterium]MDD2848333.1 DUF4403 family protein [Desulfuromonadaceae bacterium]MDD4129271.1 DUF4403 family protein [Desulfuromonadaceae bacterium]
MLFRFVVGLLCTLISTVTLCSAAVSSTAPSTINLSVDANTADLSRILNQSLQKDLYKGKGAFGASVEVIRTGPAVITAANDFIYISLPVQLSFGYGMFTSLPLKTDLHFKAKITPTTDWRLKTELYYTGLSDGLAESVNLGPLSLKPRTLADGVTQPLQKLLAPIIDTKINESVKLREKIAPLWQSAFTPVLVDKKFSAWLKLAPEKVVLGPLQAANNRLHFAVGLVTAAEITIGPKPTAVPARPLPAAQQLSAIDNQFHIRLGTDIFFTDFVTALNPLLLNQTFGDEKKITVRSFTVKGEDGKLVITLTSTGDFDGELTLIAKPVYNPQLNVLSFEDVDFDTKNAGLFIGVGSWLFSGAIRDTIKEKLNSSIVSQLESVRLKASSALVGVPLGEHVLLSGSVNSLKLGESVVANDRLSIQVLVEGASNISLR